MASSRKPPSADPAAAADAFLSAVPLHRKHLAVALSGGMDSVVLLHLLSALRALHGFRLSAIHVHHGLSPNAGEWAKFCRRVCKDLGVRLAVKRVRVAKGGEGLEAAARKARYEALKAVKADAIALAHHLDDQAETVLFNLLRGGGHRGVAGMPARGRLAGKLVLRPLLEVPRERIEAYARGHRLAWIEDESNADEALTRNFLRRRLAPLLETRFPKWREGLSRAARHAARRDADASELLRGFLRDHGLRAPSEARLADMLKQVRAGGPRVAIRHDGRVLRAYRGRLSIERPFTLKDFAPVRWKGEKRVALPALGGTVTFVRGARGLDARLLKEKHFFFRPRRGGERLQPEAKRPRRTLKNLFQEAGVPPHVRERLPLLFCGEDLAWVPGLGIDARFQGRDGFKPLWKQDA